MAALFDVKHSDRFNCHFLKSYSYSDLKAHLCRKSLGGAEYSYEASPETDITSKLLRSTEERSCEYKDIKAYNQKSLESETRWKRHKIGTRGRNRSFKEEKKN